MFRHDIKYVDYNGNEREETLYFNLSNAELAKIEAKTDGGLQDYLKRIFEEQDKGKIWDMFETIVLSAYGKKMPDGSFAKDKGRLAEKFVETVAYSDFMVWLLSDGGKNASTFINGIVPKDKDAVVAEPGASNLVPLK